MSVCLGLRWSWNRADLRGLVIGPSAMRPDNQEKKECNSHAGGSKDQLLPPTALRRGDVIQAGANAGQKRGWDFGVCSGVKASVDGGEERLFFGKCCTARGASREVRAQFALRLGTSGGGFD
jgi:hypothetical protein